jgi:hypothetical protein
MSMARCSECERLVDTDHDCEFYDYSYRTPDGFSGHCESCRDDLFTDMTEQEQREHERRVYG